MPKNSNFALKIGFPFLVQCKQLWNKCYYSSHILRKLTGQFLCKIPWIYLEYFWSYYLNTTQRGGLRMQKMLFEVVPRPTKFVNDLLFWTCFKAYSPRKKCHSGSYFPAFGYSVQMRENTNQNNSEYGHFLCGDYRETLVKFSGYLLMSWQS